MRSPGVLVLLAVASGVAPAYADPHSALLKLSSGITLHYVVQGQAGGDPVVLLHGVGDSWHSYELVLPHLPDRFRVYALSLRGHGWSDAPPSGYSQQDFASDVAAFLEALDLRRITLVGHSLGSFVAQRVAEQDRGRLARLVLVGSGPGGATSESVRSEVAQLFGSLRSGADAGFARDFQSGTTHAPVPAPFMETMFEQVRRVPGHVWPLVTQAVYSGETAAALSSISVPTLLVWGDRDALLLRADQNALLQRIPDARLVVFPGNGHAPHWESPGRFVEELLAFISRTPPPA